METREQQVWAKFKSRERVLTPKAIAGVPWDKCLADDELTPVLCYMRDIEAYTADVYFPELSATPSGRDPVFAEFLKRWTEEETTHGQLLDKVLAFRKMPGYKKPRPGFFARLLALLYIVLENLLGKHFKALHMTWGAINELATRLGYSLALAKTKDEALRYILRRIIKEESRHAAFYMTMAKIKLERSAISRFFSYWIIRFLWRPVGAQEKALQEARPLLALFVPEGIARFREEVAEVIKKLPGMSRLDLTKTLELVCEEAKVK